MPRHVHASTAGLTSHCALLLRSHPQVVKEMQKVIPREFDFRREAVLMTAIRANLVAAGLAANVEVPEPVACLSTPVKSWPCLAG
jgi:predicted unusual protein kinase regulating ubiquinone biosynthesis (AarF/ABC1/UbiB family)